MLSTAKAPRPSEHELYIKNSFTIDYRIHSGMVGGRWVRNQLAHIVRIAPEVVKISWDEPTGTAVSLAFNLSELRVHGVIFFPRWVADSPEKTICFQNDHLEEMSKRREIGPTYPKLVIDEFATLTFVEDCDEDDEKVIACSPDELPFSTLQSKGRGRIRYRRSFLITILRSSIIPMAGSKRRLCM